MEFDNLRRPRTELNRAVIRRLGVKLFHGDLRCQSMWTTCHEWTGSLTNSHPSILAAADDRTSSRQLVEHNLVGTTNLLKKCKTDASGLTLLRTRRVYAIEPLVRLPVTARGEAFELMASGELPPGVSPEGVSEDFRKAALVSLCGAAKLACEALALEYGTKRGQDLFYYRASDHSLIRLGVYFVDP